MIKHSLSMCNFLVCYISTILECTDMNHINKFPVIKNNNDKTLNSTYIFM